MTPLHLKENMVQSTLQTLGVTFIFDMEFSDISSSMIWIYWFGKMNISNWDIKLKTQKMTKWTPNLHILIASLHFKTRLDDKSTRD